MKIMTNNEHWPAGSTSSKIEIIHVLVVLTFPLILGTNLESKTELKYDYLKEAVMCLNAEDPMTKQHLPGIVSTLKAQMRTYIMKHPNSKMGKQFKMLDMAAVALLNQ